LSTRTALLNKSVNDYKYYFLILTFPLGLAKFANILPLEQFGPNNSKVN